MKVVTIPILQEITNKTLGINPQYTRCLTNETADACNATSGLLKGESILLAIYNAVNNRSQIMRVKVPTSFVQVYT